MPSNLVSLISSERIRLLGATVVRDYERDSSSREPWAKKGARYLELFSSHLGLKNVPIGELSSNANLPYLATATLGFWARAFPSILPPVNAVKISDPNSDNDEKAKRVENHMNFQLNRRIKGFRDGMSQTIIQLPIFGSSFRKTYLDDLTGEVVSEYVSAADLVFSYGSGDFDKIRRKTHRLFLWPSEIRERVEMGVYFGNPDDFKWGTQPHTNIIQASADKVAGVQSSQEETDNPREILEQHGWYDLMDNKVMEPVIVTVDRQSAKVLSVNSRRYTSQMGLPKVFEYFTKYPFIPNPEGAYGLGFGILIGGINELANTLVNEVVDAGKLANLSGNTGFISRRAAIVKGDLKFKMGEFKVVDAYSDDIKKSIYKMEFGGPSATLFQVLSLLHDHAQKVTSVSEIMTGAMPSSDTPASTILALIEEGRKVFSSIYTGIHTAFGRELEKIFILNSVSLKNDKYRLLDEFGIPKGQYVSISADDYANEYDIFPVSDPAIISVAEKAIRAEQVYKLSIANPIISQNEDAIYLATDGYLEAMGVTDEKRKKLLIKPEPKKLTPVEENAGMLRGIPAEVKPGEDHLDHIKVHEEFLNSIYQKQMEPNTKNMIKSHNTAHVAQLYVEQNQTNEGGQNAG